MVDIKKRLKPTFNIPADEVESYLQFMFLISNEADYKDYLERNHFKENFSLAFRNFFQKYICKHDDKIQAYYGKYELFKDKFLANLKEKEDGKQKIENKG